MDRAEAPTINNEPPTNSIDPQREESASAAWQWAGEWRHQHEWGTRGRTIVLLLGQGGQIVLVLVVVVMVVGERRPWQQAELDQQVESADGCGSGWKEGCCGLGCSDSRRGMEK